MVRLDTVWLVWFGQLVQMSVQLAAQVLPVFWRYCHLVIAEPPSPPEVQPRVTEASPRVAVTLVGLNGLPAAALKVTDTPPPVQDDPQLAS